jgi:hypothetical protein
MAITRNRSPHAAAEATEAAAPETTEAATAASRRIAGTPMLDPSEEVRFQSGVADFFDARSASQNVTLTQGAKNMTGIAPTFGVM